MTTEQQPAERGTTVVWCWNYHGGRGRIFGWIVTLSSNRQFLIGLNLRYRSKK
jgi:hypothetical protein